MGQGVARVSLLFSLLLVAGAGVSCGSKPAPTETLRHVVVIGASASAGYGTGAELGPDGADVPLADVLRAMIRSPEARVADRSDALFLFAPDATGAEQVRAARASDPSCVIAVDYLYWFVQGGGGSLEERRERLDAGLRHLEGFACPVLVGAIPPPRPVSGTGAGRPDGPDPATVQALDEHIAAWADARPNVHVVPLAEALADLYANRPVEVAGSRWQPPEARAEILQEDGLHPKITGLALIAALCLEVLVDADLVSEGAVDLDVRATARAVRDR